MLGPGPGVAGDEHVGRLHVAVDKAAGVRGVEGGADLRDQAQAALRAERPFALEQLRQVVAFDQPGDEEEDAVLLAGLVDRQDAGVVDRRRRPALLDEAAPECRVVRSLGRNDLEGNAAPSRSSTAR